MEEYDWHNHKEHESLETFFRLLNGLLLIIHNLEYSEESGQLDQLGQPANLCEPDKWVESNAIHDQIKWKDCHGVYGEPPPHVLLRDLTSLID